MLMCQGRCIYHGSAKDVVPYFSSHGYPFDPSDNPADFALDVLIDIGQKPQIMREFNGIYNTSWERRLTTSAQQHDVIDMENSSSQSQKHQVGRSRSFFSEVVYLSQRNIRNNRRNPSLPISQIGISIVLGLLVGLLFYDLKKTVDSGVQNRLGAVFFIVLSQIFINVTALDTLLKQRTLFIHVMCLPSGK